MHGFFIFSLSRAGGGVFPAVESVPAPNVLEGAVHVQKENSHSIKALFV